MRAWFLGFVATIVAVAACGARSSLPGLDLPEPAVEDGGPDAAPDVRDAGPDVLVEDCTDKGITYIYVVTSEYELLSFDPAISAFNPIGLLDCPAPLESALFSMAVDRKGKAYVVYRPDGELFEVSTATAACEATDFTPGQHGFVTFGMGFAADEGGPGETLYVAESHFGSSDPSMGLGVIDTVTFALGFVAPFSQPLGQGVELTGTGDGRLFGFFIDTTGSSPVSHVAQIDRANGTLTNDTILELGAGVSSFAFAFWGGDFYLFHAEQESETTVTRYSPTNGSLTEVASLPTHVVGVGVSTCAPQ